MSSKDLNQITTSFNNLNFQSIPDDVENANVEEFIGKSEILEACVAHIFVLAGHNEAHKIDIAMDDLATCHVDYLEFLGDRYFALFLTEELERRHPVDLVQFLFSHYNSNAFMNSFMGSIFGKVHKKSSDFFEVALGCLRKQKLSPKILVTKFCDYSDKNAVLYDIRKKSRNFNNAMLLRKKEIACKTSPTNYRTALKVWADVNGMEMLVKIDSGIDGFMATVALKFFNDLLLQGTSKSTNREDALELASKEAGKIAGIFSD
jgi:hypothetical protein